MDDSFDKPSAPPSVEALRHKTLYKKYKEGYGEPPKIKEFLRKPSDLWGIQEDIIKYAVGNGAKAAQSVEQIYDVLLENNIFVMNNFDKTLEHFNSNGRCVTAQSESIGEFHRLLIGSVEYYRQPGFTERQAQQYQWMVFGHELGHAIDKKFLPGVTNWETEIRQHRFNLEYSQAIGDNELEQMELEFFRELEKDGIKIL